MSQYGLTTEGRIQIKRVWTITILAAYAAIISIFSYTFFI